MFHFIHKWQIDGAYTTKMARFRHGMELGGFIQLAYTLKCIKCGRIKVFSEDISTEQLAKLRVEELLSLYPNPEFKLV